MDQEIKYLTATMKKVWKQENLHLLEEIIEEVLDEMEIMINMEEEENQVK